jgi:fermentation-respiration switch protein FrsA (DUF1100 family)
MPNRPPHADRDWRLHPVYGLVRPVPAGLHMGDDVVVAALSEQNCECLEVTPSAARVYERSNLVRRGTARLLTLPDGESVLNLAWR